MNWLKLIILIMISLGLVVYGVSLYIKRMNSGADYDLSEDLRKVFLVPHSRYSNYHHEDESSRVVPVMYILGGLFMLGHHLFEKLG